MGGQLAGRDKIRWVARDVVAWAKQLALPIEVQELGFKKKKKSMAGLFAKRSRQLSSLHYSAWGQALSSLCLETALFDFP